MSFVNYLPQGNSTANPNGRAKRAVAESRDASAQKRRRTEDDTNYLFFSDGQESADEEVVRVEEPSVNGTLSQSASVKERMNATPSSSVTTTQARTQAPVSTSSTPKTSSAPSASQQKATSKANGTSAQKKKADETEIKDEDKPLAIPSWIEGTPEIDRIRIYIGKRQRQTFATRDDIAKSSVLTGYIVEDAEQGPYIMRPQLLRTDPTDFDALLQFIHTSTFEPLLVGEGNNTSFKDMTSDYDHGRELVRHGKIYVIAQMFKVEAFQDAIYEKVRAIPARRIPNKFLVDLASVIFNDRRVGKRSDQTSGSASSSQSGQGTKDKLEEWIINKIAMNFQDIQKYVHDEFWVVEKKTTKKMLYARVLEEAAEIYRANSGQLPAPAGVVELD